MFGLKLLPFSFVVKSLALSPGEGAGDGLPEGATEGAAESWPNALVS